MVLDMNTSADMTICEEATELLHRIQARLHKKNTSGQKSPQHMPLFSSCCPGWLNYVEKFEPELAKDISTCKSPQQMYGSMIKGYSQELWQHLSNRVYVCGIMPCVLKKGEADRPVFVCSEDGIKEIDNVITTRDLGVLLRQQGIHNPEEQLNEANFDSPFAYMEHDGMGTGAGQIFGATGGVTEAAVRTVYEWLTGEPLPGIEFHAVRGLDGIKEANVPLYSNTTKKGLHIDLKVVVANGLKEAKVLVQKIKTGQVRYDFVEVMSCPGGCIGGGGQPRGVQGDVLPKRLEVIYQLDRSLPRRRAHENPIVQTFYEQYLGEYGSDRARKLLHVEPVYKIKH